MRIEHQIPSRLADVLRSIGPVTVTFSGGVDSSLLAVAAATVLGHDQAHVVTAVSASLAHRDLERCAQLAADWNLAWSTVTTRELHDSRYVMNGSDRCFWCKSHLMEALRSDSDRTIVLGVNVDDLDDHRPGQQAAVQHGARFPFVEAAMTKSEIRDTARALGLSTWDQPASPCLASRLPYGTPVSIGRLSAVERAEQAVRDEGFSDVRVRHHGSVALIEVPAVELARALGSADLLVERVRSVGFEFVALDLEGLRSGKLNRSLADEATSP